MSSAPTPSVHENPATFAELRDGFTAIDTSLSFRKPHKPAIRRGQRDYVYNVESSTRPRLFHTVDVLHLSCSCEAGRHHRRCHHLADAIQYDAWRKAQRAKSAAPAPARPAGMAALQECFL